MKKFILSMFAVSLLFVGIAAVAERAGATFKSDQKALDLISRARQAVGGDAALNGVQSMRIVGRTTRAGAEQAAGGETEIALLLPDQVMKMVKMGNGNESIEAIRDSKVILMDEPKGEFRVKVDAPAGEPGVHKKIVIKKDGVETVLTDAEADKWIAEHPDVPGDKRIIIKKDGEAGDHDVLIRRGEKEFTATTDDGKKFEIRVDHAGEGHRQNELLRLTLGLLLTAPQGLDVEYTSGGTAAIDGTNCNVVIATAAGQAFKLFLDASSNLPVAMNYTGVKVPMMTKMPAPPTADAKGDNVMFVRHKLETAEFQVRFSDYRSVNGVQLPFRWVSSVAGNVDETFDVTSYDLNPANIAEKFQQPKQMIRIKKPEIQ